MKGIDQEELWIWTVYSKYNKYKCVSVDIGSSY